MPSDATMLTFEEMHQMVAQMGHWTAYRTIMRWSVADS